MYNLFLDDCRSLIDNEIIVVRSYEEFVNKIETCGLPESISFDHDLGLDKSGADCAHWLVNYCIKNKKSLPLWSIHSGNMIGAANIRSIFLTFEKYFDF